MVTYYDIPSPVSEPDLVSDGGWTDVDFEEALKMDSESRNIAGIREVVIAVMGITGAGKSTLIKEITGNEDVQVGVGLEGCTQQVQPIRTTHNGVNLTLLDSPGFNDTYRTDTEVLDSISTFLSETYSQGFRLSGIIYLHPISNARMEGSSLRSLRMFRKLVGEDALSNVLLATSQWGRVTPDEGDIREADLRTKFWKPLIDNGAVMTRHTGGRISAVSLVDDLIAKNTRVTLDIQRELVDERKPLIETAAGSALNEDLIALQKRHEQDLAEIRQEMEQAIQENDERSQAELSQLKKQLEDQIAQDKRNRTALRERERIAARDKQRFQTQMQIIQLSLVRQKEELDKKMGEQAREREEAFAAERKLWEERVDEAHRSSQKWSQISDFANSAINAFLVYAMRGRP